MKILSAEQIYAADKFTMENQGISSDDLMERAALGLFNWMQPRLKGAQVKIHLFCGIGNNGGDGLALARHLVENGFEVGVYVVNYSEKRAADFLLNLDRLKQRKVWPTILNANSEMPEIGSKDVIVDTIFGIGLNREPSAWVVEIIKYINGLPVFTLAVDIPSGLFSNKAPKNEEAVIKAEYTLSFQLPKLVFFLPQTAGYVGHWGVLDIGFDQHYLNGLETDFELMGSAEVLPFYKGRHRFSHKGNFGHALFIGGSYGKIGAVILAARACLNAGAGLVSTLIPECGYIPMQSAAPEIMVLTDAHSQMISQIAIPFQPSVICLGMGMGTHKKTIMAFEAFLKTNPGPLVLDADALNILAERKELLEFLNYGTILTPHPGELKRLVGDWEDDFDKLDKVKAFSKRYGVIMVVKGAHTTILFEDKGYINTTGNPGMATAGSGDVLAGIITSFVAQGYEPLQAAIFAVYLHGVSGDLVAEREGYEAVTALKIISKIGRSIVQLFQQPDVQIASKTKE